MNTVSLSNRSTRPRTQRRSGVAARVAGAFLAAAFAATASGCVATYERTEIQAQGGGDLPGSFDSRSAVIPVGGVVTAKVALFNTDGNPMVGNVLSDDPEVLKVDRGQEDNEYALLAVREGSTWLRVITRGRIVESIPARVVPQPR
jgi:hypothetical protein